MTIKRRGFLATICGILLARFAPKPVVAGFDPGIGGETVIAMAYKHEGHIFYDLPFHRYSDNMLRMMLKAHEPGRERNRLGAA